MKFEKATVTVSTGEGKDKKEFTKDYNKRIVETAEDVLQLLQDSPAETLAALNYGHDLKVKAKVRQDILNENAGPDKAIDRMVADFVKLQAAMGKTVTADEARAQLKALGVLPA